MPAALLTPEMWREVRTASESGVPDAELVRRYGITSGSIRRRRCDEGWITQGKLHAEAAKQKMALVSKETVLRSSQAPSAVEVITANVLELAERNGLRIAQLADRELGSVGSLPITTWRDASTAIRTLRTVAGLDKPAVSISLGAWSTVKLDADAEG